jgi:hypothetical protein
MIKFNHYQVLTEAKNTHMEHLEDLIFNEGVAGTRKAINFLRDLRDMLSGSSKSSISRTVKWDGAPAVFAGIDPRDGKFFVAKKGIFNKNPKVYKTPADVKADTSGDLQAKLLIALSEFSKLGIKKGVYQGDLMFTSGDVTTENIDGQSYYTFQPNTIVYAVPVGSALGKSIARAKIGIVWHTTYTGDSFESMSASFGKDIVKNFANAASVWQDDANYKDLSGTATFTKSETDAVTKVISTAGTLFRKIPAKVLDEFKNNQEFQDKTKVYNNTYVRAGKKINPKTHVKGLMNYIYDFYQKEIDKKKTDKSKETWKAKRKEAMAVFNKYNKKDLENVFTLMNLLADAKEMIINKMNQAGSMNTFLRTRSGFKVTDVEGFVAIDHLSNDAVKIVNRLEFSRANFSPDVIKGWEK